MSWGGRLRRWWPRIRLVLTVLFFAGVTVLLVIHARQVDWPAVAAAMRRYAAGTLLCAAALGIVGHGFYTTYDLLARRYTCHRLPWPRVVGIAFVSYAFNLNLGPLVGALAFRFRLYSAFGLDNRVITRVLGFSIVTNWLGYLLLAGALFAARVVELPANWAIGTTVLQAAGIVMVGLVAAYVLLCARATRRSVTVHGVELELPPVPMAGLQIAASCASWFSIGGVLYVLMPEPVPFATVLGVLLVAAVAALATHIPAGLGVLEGTFVLLLGHSIAPPDLLGAVLAYRVIYYLAPLVLALGVYAVLEARARHQPVHGH